MKTWTMSLLSVIAVSLVSLMGLATLVVQATLISLGIAAMALLAVFG